MKNKNLNSLTEILDKEYGKKGTKRRDEFEKGYEEFKLGILIQQARLEKGLTQEQLAEKCGTNKGYISKVENNIKDVRLSTLQKIVEIGLGDQEPKQQIQTLDLLKRCCEKEKSERTAQKTGVKVGDPRFCTDWSKSNEEYHLGF